LSNILFVSSEFSPELLAEVIDMIHKFEKAELKGQRVSKKVLKQRHSAVNQKIDFPPTKLKVLRGEVTAEELLKLLKDVNSKTLSLYELEAEASRIKEMRAVQNVFVKLSGSSSWETAKKR
jgi:glutamate synthase domain-containing protein 2